MEEGGGITNVLFLPVYFPDVELFVSQRYIIVVEEGPEECIFDHEEAPACEGAVMQQIRGKEAGN